ncbi:S-layer homology domain-containing protein [Paenibacillus sp. PK3_47]|uniref:RCC1 domain-containing protein n=1 Tax=Paenibacillus sp. PK3_47 TaxID=2072642 RepID=UPI00201E10AE|nr:S-layer homology domain-containing protein [Paenibacillus sp. PK3_47]
MSGIKAIKAGTQYVLALTTAGEVYAWGTASNGNLGLGELTTTNSPTKITGLSNIVDISPGLNHALAVDSSGRVYGWGLNNTYQLGMEDTSRKTTPILIPELSGVVEADAGSTHSLVRLQNGDVYAFGSGQNGQLGLGSDILFARTPTKIEGLSNISSINAGVVNSVAIRNDGTAFVFGDNAYGVLGQGDQINRFLPTPVPGLSLASADPGVFSLRTAPFITTAGELYLAGDNTFGLISAEALYTTVPKTVTSLTYNIIDIEAGSWGVVALNDRGEVYGFGLNNSNELGPSVAGQWGYPAPTKLPVPEAKAISLSSSTTLILTKNGEVYGLGNNVQGPIGNGTTTGTSTPVRVALPGPAIYIAGGDSTSFAILEDGSVYAWGYNSNGQLGNGTTTTPQLLPVQVNGLPSGVKAVQVSGGYRHTLIVMENGDVYAMGYNSNGQLGTGNTTNSTTAVKVTGLPAPARKAVAGLYSSLVLLNNGTVYGFGSNSNGVLGLGNVTQTSTPTLVPGLTNVIDVELSFYVSSSAAITSNGDVYTFGLNNYGQLGLGDLVNRSTPQKVNGLQNAVTVDFGGSSIASGLYPSAYVLTNSTATLDSRIVQADRDSTNFTTTLMSRVTGSLPLPSVGPNGSAVTWSSQPNLIAPNGTVTRPTEQDQFVELTAVFSSGSETATRSYRVLVRKQVDPSALVPLLQQASTLSSIDYTPATWTPVQNSMTNATYVTTVSTATYVQSDIISMTDSFRTRLASLSVVPADTAAAQALLEGTAGYTAGNYPQASWDAFVTSRTALEDYLNSANSGITLLQSQVNQRVTNLRNAANTMLRERGQSLLTTVSTLVESDYTDGWAAFAAARDQLSTVLADATSTLSAIDTATNDLQAAIGGLVIATVDKTAANALIQRTSALTPSDYTPDSWAAMIGAGNVVVTMMNDQATTQSKLDAAVALLQAAADALVAVPTNATPAEEVADYAGDLVASDYSGDSFAAVQNALAALQDLLNDPAALQSQIDAARSELVSAINALDIVPVEEADAQEGLDAVADLSPEDYNPVLWSAVAAAQTALQELLNNPNATQSQVNAATEALNNAIAALTPSNPPQELLDQIADLTAGDYLPATWAAIEAAREILTGLLGNPEATQAQINAATTVLQQALTGLIPTNPSLPADPVELVNQVDALTADDYTPETWSIVEAAQLDLIAALQGGEAAVIQTAREALQNALASLTPVPVSAGDAQEQLAAAADLAQEDYSPAAWATVEAARATLQALITNANATQSQIDAAAEVLSNAIAALTPSNPPQDLLDQIDDLVEGDYLPATWAIIEASRTLLQNLLNAQASQELIAAAVDTLQGALNGLVPINPSVPVEPAVLLNQVDRLEPSDYTSETWDAVQEASQNLSAALQGGSPATVQTAKRALQTALAGLTIAPVNDENAQGQLDAVSGMTAGDYTPESWALVEAVRSLLETLLANPDATQSQINEVTLALGMAISQLTPEEPEQPSSPAEELLTEIDQLTPENYLPSAWAAIDAAREVLENLLADTNATQAQIDAAVAVLQEALAGLIPTNPSLPVNPENLLDQVGDLVAGDYSPETWSAVEEARTALETALQSGDTSAIQTAKAAMQNALTDLTIVPVNGTNAQEQLATVTDLTYGDYTPATWAKVEVARGVLEQLLNNQNATQSQIDAAVAALSNAIAALVTTQPEQPATPTPAPTPNPTPTPGTGGGGNPGGGTGGGGGGGGGAVIITPSATPSPTPTATATPTPAPTPAASAGASATPMPSTAPKVFSDVRGGQWFKQYVDRASSLGILEGVDGTRFEPTREITRAEFSAVLVRALGLEAASGQSAGFSDVAGSRWYADVIATANQFGLIAGYEDNTFRPNQPITREEAMVIISRAMNLISLQATSATGADILNGFKDSGLVSNWAQSAVEQNVAAGLIQGNNGSINPKNEITRAEVAAIVIRFLEKAGRI